MADNFGVYCRQTGADMEFVDKISGLVVFAFRKAANNQIVQATADNLTAHVGGGQANGLLLTAAYNRFTTVTSGNDSALMPPSLNGLDMVIINAAAANAMNIFPALGDQINTLGVNAAFNLAANKTVTFYCCTSGQWHTQLTA
jgi:hypothetical protein